MFKKISTSYNLVKVAFRYVKKDGELLIYSIFSLLASLVILITFTGIGFLFIDDIESITNTAENNETLSNIITYTVMFVYYLIFSFITFFFNTAIITSVQRRINGQDNTFGDGLKDAIKHIKEIFIWSLINATISTILKILQNMFKENGMIGRIIIGLIGGVWNVITFFSFPLMILHGVGPKDAVKQSASLFKKTWGERAIIHVGVGLLFTLLFLGLFIISGIIAFSGFIISGIILIVLGTIFLIILSSTCDVIIKTILLYYAQNGKLPDGLENEKQIIDMAGTK